MSSDPAGSSEEAPRFPFAKPRCDVCNCVGTRKNTLKRAGDMLNAYGHPALVCKRCWLKRPANKPEAK